jgi:hypothetical protein
MGDETSGSMKMTDQQGIREQADALLELSNRILASALGECWEEMDELIRRRADLLERVYGPRGMSGANRAFLDGVMEHVRIVDAATRRFLDRERNGGWPERRDETLRTAWLADDLEVLNPGDLRFDTPVSRWCSPS